MVTSSFMTNYKDITGTTMKQTTPKEKRKT